MQFKVTEKAKRSVSNTDTCFYCGQPIGDYHKPECVLISKKVKVRMVVEYEVEVPSHWDKHNVEFHRNDSSWCADSAVNELQKIVEDEESPCLCELARFEYIEDTSGPFLSE